MVGSKPLTFFVSVAVFMMGAIALIAPSGYSIGAGLLLLASPVLLLQPLSITLTRQDKWIIAVLFAYCAVVGGLGGMEAGAPGFDRPSRFLLAIPVLLLILHYPPLLSWLWGGLALGAIGAGSWALWQNLVLNVERADGFVHVIQFGNLSMLMGVFSLAGLGWALGRRGRALWFALLLAGACLGMLGSLLSGSRGGWIGLPFIAFVLYRSYGRGFSLKTRAVAVGLILAIAAIMYVTPQTGVQERIQAGINDVTQYVGGGDRDTSLGLRFQMWRGAGLLIAKHPVLGWGDTGYVQAMQALGESGQINPAAAGFDHAHNDFIDATAKRGVVGLTILLALYLVPMRLFASGLSHENYRVRSIAVAGTLLPVAYIDFGLSQTFMAHNSGAMFYAFWLAVWWGAYSAYRRQSAAVAASFTH
ncbi:MULTISPECIES: O-antigen ligase family protein [unclassified Halomonas]|uniref:O-antigen ligase family protein n=1 Tax=unclassified Halomonas TaxID=2609666 RepID=UPI0020767B76|nr:MULTISPECIES: O-antigen ligase family protein [unclassified Halomonas]